MNEAIGKQAQSGADRVSQLMQLAALSALLTFVMILIATVAGGLPGTLTPHYAICDQWWNRYASAGLPLAIGAEGAAAVVPDLIRSGTSC